MERTGSKVVLVTSTIANEGKTTLSVNLALALAQKEKRVLLLGCDLRNPSVASAMGKEPGLGLSEYLTQKVNLEQILHHDNDPYLYTVYGGKLAGRPERLLTGREMKSLIAAARQKFDYIILDTPPCALMADASEILTLADCAVLTVRQNYACRQQILEGVQVLSESDNPILGCVISMNASGISSGHAGSYGYYGGYGHYGEYGKTNG